MNLYPITLRFEARKHLIRLLVTSLLCCVTCLVFLRHESTHGISIWLPGNVVGVVCFIGLATALIYFAATTATDLVLGAFCVSAKYTGRAVGHVFARTCRMWKKCKQGG